MIGLLEEKSTLNQIPRSTFVPLSEGHSLVRTSKHDYCQESEQVIHSLYLEAKARTQLIKSSVLLSFSGGFGGDMHVR